MVFLQVSHTKSKNRTGKRPLALSEAIIRNMTQTLSFVYALTIALQLCLRIEAHVELSLDICWPLVQICSGHYSGKTWTRIHRDILGGGRLARLRTEVLGSYAITAPRRPI